MDHTKFTDLLFNSLLLGSASRWTSIHSIQLVPSPLQSEFSPPPVASFCVVPLGKSRHESLPPRNWSVRFHLLSMTRLNVKVFELPHLPSAKSMGRFLLSKLGQLSGSCCY
eukprot:Trichotokara_eunicae@DN5774_c0_g1_i1.p1